MTSEQRSSLVLAFARVLYVNGQATEQTVTAAEQLGRILGLRAKVMPRWGELQLRSDDENGAVLIFVSAAAGAILRRGVARVSVNVFLQPFCAAFVAGVIGALAVRYQLSSSLRLVAVCP